MGSSKKRPRYHVVSLRVSDTEREALDAFAQQTDRSISTLMREAMGVFLKQRVDTHGQA